MIIKVIKGRGSKCVIMIVFLRKVRGMIIWILESFIELRRSRDMMREDMDILMRSVKDLIRNWDMMIMISEDMIGVWRVKKSMCMMYLMILESFLIDIEVWRKWNLVWLVERRSRSMRCYWKKKRLLSIDISIK